MNYQPPAQANSFSELAPPGTTLTQAAVAPAFPDFTPAQVMAITQTTGITTTQTTLLPNQTRAISYNNGQVGVVIESGTFSQTVNLQFALLSVGEPASLPTALPTTLPANPDTRIYQEQETFLTFQIEASNSSHNQPIELFAKKARLAIDVRGMGYELPPAAVYFLAYRSPEDPNRWIEVPLTVYEPGFYSADVDHFSEWATGWRPESWALSWSPPAADGFSGAATYSYPFQLPPGRNGLQPALALSYANSALNGATRQVAAGTVATGWSLNQLAIIRTGVKLNQSSTGMEFPDTFRLVLNGTGHKIKATEEPLINGGLRYTAENGPQLFILRYDNYWLVRTGDGTTYRLGYTPVSRTWHYFVLNEHLDHDEDPETHAVRQQDVIEWHVDTITDTSGNQIIYEYDNSLTTFHESYVTVCNLYPYPPGWCAIQISTQASRLTDIYYNFTNRITNLPPAHNMARLNPANAATPAATRVQLLYDNIRFHTLRVYHNSVPPIREYELYSAVKPYQNPGCPVSSTEPRWTTTVRLQTITEFGWDQATGQRYALPPTSFDYEGRANFVHDDLDCFIYDHLKWAANGYGGKVELDYSSDGRAIGVYDYDGSGPLEYPLVGFSHFVTELRQYDGRGNVSRLTYARHGACYNQTHWVGGACPAGEDAPQYGVLSGFHRVETFAYKLDGSTIERQEESWYYTGDQIPHLLIGRPFKQETKGGTGNLHQRVETGYHNLPGDFRPVSVVTTTLYSNNLTLSTKVSYEYAPADQGGTQYGNLTHIREYDDAAAATPFRITRRWFTPNVNVTGNYWLVSLMHTQAMYATESGPAKAVQYIHYDGQPLQAAPTQGRVTRTRQANPDFSCTQMPGGGGSGCTSARQTIDQVNSYDPYGNLIASTSYPGYGYQSFNNGSPLVDILPTGGRTTSIQYNPVTFIYPVKMTDPGGYITQFEIYGFRNADNVLIPPDGFQRHTGLLKRVIAANGVVSLYEYDPFGRLVNVYDSPGDRGSLNNPWDGNPVSRYQYFDSNWVGVQLDPANNKPFPIAVMTRPQTYHTGLGGPGYEFKQVTYYDGLGRPIQSQDRWVQVDGVAIRQDRIVTTAYDAWGRSTCTTVPYTVDTYIIRTGGNSSGFLPAPCTTNSHSRTEYDDLGRVTVVKDSNGNPVSQYQYALTNHITVGGSNRLQRTMITDANNHRVNQFSNSRGELVLVREIMGTGSSQDPYIAHADTRYQYDLLGNLIHVGTSAPSDTPVSTWLRLTSISYDGFGRKVGMNDPDMGVWSYSYDAASNLIRQQDAKGQVLCFFYDTLDRMVSKRQDSPVNGCSPTDPLRASYNYYGPGNGGSTGQVAEIRWPDTQNREMFTYDSKGRIQSHTRTIAGRPFTLGYGGYDLLNRPTLLTYPNGDVVQMVYDREGEEQLKISSDFPVTSLVNQVSYTSQGQLRRLVRGGGMETLYHYYPWTGSPGNGNNSGRLHYIRHGNWHDALPDFTYSYDKVGNIISTQTDLRPVGHTQTYYDLQFFAYDSLNRLKTASGTANPPAGFTSYQELYAYDLLGNLTQLGHQGQTTLEYHNPAHKHAATHRNNTLAFTYDQNGNMLTRNEGTITYNQQYDPENRLTQVTESGNNTWFTQFSYDAGEQRTLTIDETAYSQRTTTYYPFPLYEEAVIEVWREPNQCPILESPDPPPPGCWETWQTIQRAVYTSAGHAIATRVTTSPPQPTDGLFYFITDHLGSTRLLATPNGSPVPGTTAHYLPYGDYRGSTPTATPLTERGYTGHHENREIGLTYMNARFYSPTTGRFLTADTIIPSPTNPQSHNRYSYVLGNPLILVDLTGHYSCYTHGQNEHCLDDAPSSSNSSTYPTYINLGSPIVFPTDTTVIIELGYIGASPVSIIILPPGSGISAPAPGVGRFLDTLGALMDLAELLSIFTLIPALPDVLAGVDLFIEFFATIASGDSFLFERPHLSSPVMAAIGQDVWVALFDLLMSTVGEFMLVSGGFYFGGMHGFFTGYGIAQWLDASISGASVAYDILRLTGDIPNYMSFAIYFDERSGTTIPFPGFPMGQPGLAIVIYLQ